MLTKSQEYSDQGQDYYDERYRERVLRALTQRAAKMGMQRVPIAQAAGKTHCRSVTWEVFLERHQRSKRCGSWNRSATAMRTLLRAPQRLLS
jgi:hypothetical protein